MSDVSCRAVGLLLDVLEEDGADLDEFLNDTDLTVEFVSRRSNRVSWEQFGVLLGRAAIFAGSRRELQDRVWRVLARRERRWASFLRSWVGPTTLYRMLARMVPRELGPVSVQVVEVGPGRLEIALEVRDDREMLAELPDFVAAMLRAVPLTIGAPDAGVHWNEVGRSWVFQVRTSPSWSVLARMGRVLRAVFRPDGLVRELEEQAGVLGERLMTLREAQAQAVAASEAKTQFLLAISHELRTPLNGILGTTELLLDQSLPPKRIELVRANRASAIRLRELIGRMLDFTELCSDEVELERKPLEPVAVVERAVQQRAVTLRKQGTVLEVFACARRPVVGDADRLSVVVDALVDNAMRHAAGGRVSIYIHPPTSSQMWRFVVEDDGCGMNAFTLRRLFQPLTSADGGLTRPDGGIGLGVAIARRLVEAMDGSITCTSSPGTGARFQFTARLPAAGEPEEVKPSGHVVAVVARDVAERDHLAGLVRSLGLTPHALVATSAALEDFAKAHPAGIVVTNEPREKTRIGFRWRELKVCVLSHLRTTEELRRQLPVSVDLPEISTDADERSLVGVG